MGVVVEPGGCLLYEVWLLVVMVIEGGGRGMDGGTTGTAAGAASTGVQSAGMMAAGVGKWSGRAGGGWHPVYGLDPVPWLDDISLEGDRPGPALHLLK